MPEVSNLPAPPAAAAEAFSSLAELWQAHLALRQTLSKGDTEPNGISTDIRVFIARARATGALLGPDNERKTAQGILDYWSTELVSLPGTIEADFEPALLTPIGDMRIVRQTGEAAAVEKRIEDESRELVRIAALARQYRDSGKQYGYLLNDDESIAQASRFKHQDPDIFELVADSEIALNKKRTTQRLVVVGAIFGLVVIGMIGLTTFQELRLREAKRTAAASIDSVERILKVLSKQTDQRTIPIAAAAELFSGAESILTTREQQPGGERPEVIEEHARLLIKFSDVSLDAGDSKRALALVEQAAKLASQPAKLDPGNDTWQQLVYQSAFRIGDVLVLTDRQRTNQEYDLALTIAKALASKDRDNVERQRDVAFITNKMGDLDLLDSAWGSALSWYQKSLDIGQGLRANEPKQQRIARKIVGDAWARLGGLSTAQGHFDEALKQYQEALNVRSSLVKEDPENDVYQGNLAATYHFMGDVYKSYYDASKDSDLLDKALRQYDEALKLRQARASEDPGNASRQDSLQQEDLAIADVLMQKQDVAGAIAKYQAALGIREALAFKDPDNVGWKANLAITRDKLATALAKDQQLDAALTQYDAALQVRQDLATRFPESRSRQSQLAGVYERKGDLLATRGKSQKRPSDLRDAADAYQAGLAIIEPFMRKDPNSGLEPARERLRKKIEGLASGDQ